MKTFNIPVIFSLQQETTITVRAENEDEALETIQNMSDMELIRRASDPVELEVEILDGEIEESDEDSDDEEDDEDVDIDDEDEYEEED